MKITFQFLLLFMFPLVVASQTAGEQLKKYEAKFPLEKVYIAHDRPYYAPGDTIWCQAYLVEGRTHLSFDAAPILFVEWYNPQEECVRSFSLRIEEGSASFEIPTALTDTNGVYQLRAYTQYQRNFDAAFQFQKSILLSNEIPQTQARPISQDYSVQLFPEGGYAIEGMKNKLAFKALDEGGEGIMLDAVLRYKNGDTIQTVKSVHEGVGVFFWTPEKGRQYELLGQYKGKEKTFSLPKPLSEGYVLSANNRGADYCEVTVQASPGLSLKGLELLGHLRGQVFLSEIMEQETVYKLRIPRDKVPTGLIHLTLFDSQKRPLAERLVFNRNPEKEIQVQVGKNQDDFGMKAEVLLGVQTKDKTGEQSSSLSLSVFNSSLVAAQKEANNIESYLWLQSDLKGYLPNVHQYFITNSAKTRVLLDYILLTHGWSRFSWQEVLGKDGPQFAYPPQEHIAIAGRISKTNSDEGIKADVFLNVLSEDDFSSFNLTTEEDGLFYFKGFDFMDTTNLVIQANVYNSKKKGKLKEGTSKRTGNKNVDIEMIDLNSTPFVARQTDLPSFSVKNVEKYAAAVQNNRIVEQTYSNLIQADIAEVTVKGSRLSLRQEQEEDLRAAYREQGLAYSPSAKKLFMDDLADKGQAYQDFYELVGARLPGVVVDRSEPGNKKIFLTNVNVRITQDVQPSILVIDGMIIDQAQGNTPPFIQPIDIEYINVISPVQASILYGDRAIGGAVVIIMRKGFTRLGDQSARKTQGTLSISHPGYYTGREFYVPDYSKEQKVNPKPDLRTTLYWNPKVSTKTQKDKLQFYTGDQPGIYVIQVEGITEDGRPFVHWEEMVVEN